MLKDQEILEGHSVELDVKVNKEVTSVSWLKDEDELTRTTSGELKPCHYFFSGVMNITKGKPFPQHVNFFSSVSDLKIPREHVHFSKTINPKISFWTRTMQF